MKKYLIPLWVFVVGNVLLLFVFLFLDAVGDTVDAGVASVDNVTYASTFWNWSTIANSSVVKFLVIFIAEITILFATAKAFLKVH